MTEEAFQKANGLYDMMRSLKTTKTVILSDLERLIDHPVYGGSIKTFLENVEGDYNLALIDLQHQLEAL